MKFSLIHPTRSRPKKSRQTMLDWIRNMKYKDFEMIVSLDEDDPQLGVYGVMYPDPKLYRVNKNKSAVDAINNAAAASSGNILVVVSDDSTCPPNWDEAILKAVEGKSDFLLRVSDGHQKRICTLPIMDRVYYNRFGYIYNPIYSHSWADTELTEVAYQLGRIIVRNDIVFPHLHPEVTKEPKDDLYKRNDLTHDRDRPLYQQRKKINFGL